MTALRVWQRLATPVPMPVPASRCELCGAAIGPHHRHVLDRERGALDHACHACGVLFARDTIAGRFRTIPQRVIADPSLAIASATWVGLGLPLGLAFVVATSAAEHAVCFPGPAGVACARLTERTWHALVEATPLATTLAPDVEALLVYGQSGATQLDCFLIPLDLAYDLARRLRRSWRGFEGGDAARREIAGFFLELAHRSHAR